MRKKDIAGLSKDKGKRRSSSDKPKFEESRPVRRANPKEKEEDSSHGSEQTQANDKSKSRSNNEKSFSKESHGKDKRKSGESRPVRRTKPDGNESGDKYTSDNKRPYDKSRSRSSDDKDKGFSKETSGYDKRKSGESRPVRRTKPDGNTTGNKYNSENKRPYDKSRSRSGDDKGFSKDTFQSDGSKTRTFEKKDSDQAVEKFRKTPGGYREHKRRTQELIRLNKFIANAGYCSRREADTLISSGAVRVNGVMITELGFKVEPNAVVSVDNETLKQEKFQYILLNKPKDVITTCDDPQGRMTVLNLIKGACKERVYPVGRLDRNTTGLLIMTNDGDFAKKIAHPSSKVKKLYEVSLDKKLKHEHFEEISKGVWIDENTFVDVDDLDYVDSAKAGNVVGIEIHSGKYHVVKKIFEKFGYLVTKLDRTKIDVLTKKDLARGRWRFLTESEINLLNRH
jgi:23S rRNA pseudouridine2605 synthase